MSVTTTLRQVSAVAVAAGALFAAALPAHGAVIVSSFDPLVGAPFPNDVSYRGTASFTIADACLGGNAVVTNGFTPLDPVFGGPISTCLGGSPMQLESASVTFFRPGGDLATLIFGAGSIQINGVLVSEGEVVGLETEFAADPLSLDLPGIFIGSVALRFAAGDLRQIRGGAELQLNSDGSTFISNRATNITFNRVPEPGTLALFALAAVGAGVATRRRQAA